MVMMRKIKARGTGVGRNARTLCRPPMASSTVIIPHGPRTDPCHAHAGRLRPDHATAGFCRSMRGGARAHAWAAQQAPLAPSSLPLMRAALRVALGARPQALK